MPEEPTTSTPANPAPTDQPQPETTAPPAPETPVSTPQETAPVAENPAPAPEPAPVTTQAPTPTPPAAPPTAPPAKPQSKKLFFILTAVVLLGVSAFFAYILSAGTQNQTSTTNATSADPKTTTDPKKSAANLEGTDTEAYSKLFIYGSWNGQTSLIKAVELASQKTTLVASLPSAIKKVNVLSAQTLMFIDQTNNQDHGKQLVIYNIKTKAPQGSITASQGFGIDDYVLSPDKKYVALWEVSLAPNSQVLQGGKSRVFAVDLRRPTVKKLLYDEKVTLTEPIHYPRAILNNGRVFSDKFIPNDPKGGAGWAYGMSIIDADGTKREDLPQMQAGTYGTQPSLSPDGKHLIFAGYDGARGDGNVVNSGYRQALLTPNTIEILETDTLTRKRFAAFENRNTYPSASWDHSNGKIILTMISSDADKTGVYAYDMTSQKLEKINPPETSATRFNFLTQLTDSTSIIGALDTSASNFGNLGSAYAFPFTQVALYDVESSKVSFLKLEDTFAQYITILPGNYFKAVLGMQANAQTTTQPKLIFEELNANQTDSKSQQPVFTSSIKNDLATNRVKQQSQPVGIVLEPGTLSSLGLFAFFNNPASNTSEETDSMLSSEIVVPSGKAAPSTSNKTSSKLSCMDLVGSQCAAQLGLGVDSVTGKTETPPAFTQCVVNSGMQNSLAGTCTLSPLYLYGPTGQQVSVTIHTPVSNALPAYKNGYAVTLHEGGTMEISGKHYQRIKYDYSSNLKKITPPKYGSVVAHSAIEKTLRHYASKLGLNEKETIDLVVAGKQKITAPYAFISFFNQKTSEQILPISFSPKPDNYLNVVFYFKNLYEVPTYSPLPPIFPEPVARDGFTAIEVSEMVE